jgi:hypothetical protein
MPVLFEKYKKTYNKYCLSYEGIADEHVIQLKLLLPSLKTAFPDIQIHLACPKNKLYLLDDGAIANEELDEDDFLCIRRLKTKLTPPHVIYNLALESGVLVQPVRKETNYKKGTCLIVPEGIPPTKSFKNISFLQQYARANGFKPMVVGSDLHRVLDIDFRPSGKERLDLVNEAEGVIGVESDLLFLAGARGKFTSLVPTGLGTQFYQKLFPKGKIIENSLAQG